MYQMHLLSSLQTVIFSRLGRGGGKVVSMLAFY